MDSIPFAEFAFLYVGLGIFLVVAIAVVVPNTLPTPRGRLNRQRRELRHCLYARRQAEKTAEKAGREHAKLHRRAKEIQPKQLRQAREHAADMQTLLGHANDQVLVAENHVRRILLDEFPPAIHQQLLRKYLPQ